MYFQRDDGQQSFILNQNKLFSSLSEAEAFESAWNTTIVNTSESTEGPYSYL